MKKSGATLKVQSSFSFSKFLSYAELRTKVNTQLFQPRTVAPVLAFSHRSLITYSHPLSSCILLLGGTEVAVERQPRAVRQSYALRQSHDVRQSYPMRQSHALRQPHAVRQTHAVR